MARRKSRTLPFLTKPQGKWLPGTYREAVQPFEPIAALLYRWLAMRLLWHGSPKGRRPPTWTIMHVGSGHLLVNFTLHDPIPLATEIAECGDWDFTGLDGWKNLDPDLEEKYLAVKARYPKVKFLRGGGHRSHAGAAEVARLNA